MPDTSSPKYAPMATAIPLMHGSTSPAKKGSASCSQRLVSRTRAMARRASGLPGAPHLWTEDKGRWEPPQGGRPEGAPRARRR